MSKAKAYTKMILERLQKKAEIDKIKSNGSSNQKTEATPSINRKPDQHIQSFFEHFETNCAVYHEPVRPIIEKKVLARRLQY